MAIRTTIVNKTKNADGTYSEKEIHPFTDMNAVVSLEAVSGNYDAYTSLPLEGAPQNALTAFLNTRSYLYSLRNFKNKTVTNNYTETTNLTSKVPSMQALYDACNDCKSMALDGINKANNANANANARIPMTSITDVYDVSNPSDSLVLNQYGAYRLYNNLYGDSSLESLRHSLTSMILSSPGTFFDTVMSMADPSQTLTRDLHEVSYYTTPSDCEVVFYKITVYPYESYSDELYGISQFLNNDNYSTNDLTTGVYSELHPPIYETCIVAVCYLNTNDSFLAKIYEEVTKEFPWNKFDQPSSILNFSSRKTSDVGPSGPGHGRIFSVSLELPRFCTIERYQNTALVGSETLNMLSSNRIL